MSEGSDYYRPLVGTELLLYEINKAGGCYISYLLRVSSTRPITEEDGKELTTALYRKCPNLRLCVAEKEEELWLKHMKEEKVDFQVMENVDVFETYNRIPYDYTLNLHDGPLWCVRLLPYSTQQDSYIKETTSADGEKPKLPNLCHFVIFFSHVITDGYSCMRVAKTLLTLINAKVSGEAIDESQQIGTLIDVNQEKRMQEKIEESFLKDPQLLERRKQSAASAFFETIFEKAFPVVPLLKPRTLCLVHVVDKLKTKNFIDRCKKEGVTVHTGFCALAERAAVKMMQEKGYRPEKMKLSSLHSADNRVYYKNSIDELGVGIGILDFTHHISTEEIIEDFWTAAKKYHLKFKEQHKQMPGIEHQVIEKLTQENLVDLLSPEGQAEPSKKMTYYATTNMRDITSLLGNIGSNVQLEFLDRLSSMHLIPCIWTNTFDTFNGRFIHSLQYNTHIMDAAVAKSLSDTIMEMMIEVTE